MKSYLAILILYSCTFLASYSQDTKTYIEGSYFHTNFTDGVGEAIPFKFRFENQFLDKLENSELFKLWVDQTYSNPENKIFIENNKDRSKVEVFLNSKTGMASILTKMKLKNTTSYTILQDAEGFIEIEEDGDLYIEFPFKGQNGFGNLIFLKSTLTEKVVDGKIVREVFVIE